MFKRRSSSADFRALSNVAQVFFSQALSADLVQKVVDQALLEISQLSGQFHVAVLGLLEFDDKKKPIQLRRHAVSFVKGGKNVQAEIMSQEKFKKIVTPMTAAENYCIKAILEKKPQLTHSYVDVLHPPLPAEECLVKQSMNKVKTCLVFPIMLEDKPIGMIIFSTRRMVKKLGNKETKFIEDMCNFIAIAVNNNQMFAQIKADKKKLEKTNDQLRSADEIKDEFISLASHELRTPLTAIKNAVFMARKNEKVVGDARLFRFLDITYQSTDRLITTVNNMLTISKMDSELYKINKQPVNFVAVMERVVQELMPIADENKIYLKIVRKGVKKPSIVKGDELKLHRLFTNLIGNALKFTKEGGVTVEMTVSDNYYSIAIIDTGMGIKEEDLKRVFVKFARLEEHYVDLKESGTGLGLYIAQHIAKKHGGKITVKSELGKGSTFTINLPIPKN
ncbi:MAG: GAF domain-containing sensor histidine kinase [Pseudomonadales bacterium]|jgi:signal transduction histidine kinase|nr:GAF domain-containing sensor histidine kinase [Pseudomonadales bacterium]